MIGWAKRASLGGMLLALALGSRVHAEVLTVPGSGNPAFALSALAEAFNRQQTEHSVLVPSSSGTAGAVMDVEAGTTSLGRVGRPLKPDEAALGLVFVPLGRDPVVFVGGAGVSLKGITREQAVAAYQGRATNWRDFGGKSGPIRAIGRESTDASRQAIDRQIGAFDNMVFGPEVKVVHLDPQMVALLDRFPGSLGFLNRSALGACQSKIGYLSLDGVEPTAANLAAGRYPLSLAFGLIHKPGKLSPAASAFIDFIGSPAGSRILRGLGVLPAGAAS